MFELQSQMNKQELFEFGEKSIQKELNTEDYLEKHEENLALTSKQLNEAYQKPLDMTQPIKGDMPQNDPEEKESKRRKRQKNQLTAQGKQVNDEHREKGVFNVRREEYVRNEGKLDKSSLDTFQETLKPEMFSPKYVLEHFKEVRQKLDEWKEHLRVFGEGGAGVACLKRDQQIRIEKMRTMYTDGERALESALAALGFQCETKRNGDLKITELNDPERVQQALQENINLRKALQNQGDIDQKVAEQLMAEKIEELTPMSIRDREKYRNDEDYSFIRTEHMNHFYHYDAIKTVKDLLESHPEKYQANKAVLDRMYQEVFNLMEVSGEYTMPALASDSLQREGEVSAASKGVFKALREIESKYSDKNEKLVARADCIIAGIKNILVGKPMTDREAIVAHEFMRSADEREQHRQAAEADAVIYADTYREKQAIFESLAMKLYGEGAEQITAGDYGRYMMLMEPEQYEHNVEVVKFVLTKRTGEKIKQLGGEDAKAAEIELGKAAKPLVLPYLQRLRDYDTSMLASCTDEELIARSEELQNLYISGMQIADMAKYTDPDDPQGRSIKEVFVEGKKEQFALKSGIVQEYAVKARMLALTNAYVHGVLTKECFTRVEQVKIRSQYNLSDEEEIGTGPMLAYVKDVLVKSELRKDASYNKYFHSQEAFAQFVTSGELAYESSHKNFDEEMDRVYQEGAKRINGKNSMNDTEIKTYYEMLKAREAEIRQELEEEDELGMRTLELQEELEKLQKDMHYLNNWYALTNNHYKMAGDEKELISEAIFRSYRSADRLDSFRNMGEENFETMCRQLSAGALELDHATPEEIAAYRAENVKGLLTYKEHMREHYEMLEQRFHHKAPSPEYIAEHYDELRQLFANVQVDVNLVNHSRDMIDLRKEEDARLYHLVQTYNAIAGYALYIGTLANSAPDYKDAMKGAGNAMRDEGYSIAYLDREHEKLTHQEQEERFARVSQQVAMHRQEREADLDAMKENYRQELASLRTLYGEYMEGAAQDEATQELANAYERFQNVAAVKLSKDSKIERLTQLEEALAKYRELGEQTDGMTGMVATLLEEKIRELRDIVRAWDVKEQQTQSAEKTDLKELEEAEALVVIEKFRTVQADDADISKASTKLRLNYLHQYAEMKSYIEKYEGISSITLEQFKRWKELTDIKAGNAAANIFEDAYSEEVPQVLQNEESLRSALSSEDAGEVVRALMELEKANLIFQNWTITEAEQVKVQNNPKNMAYQAIANELIQTPMLTGIGKNGAMPVEKRKEFIDAFYTQYMEATTAMQEEAARLLPLVPEEISEEDKILYALCLANETEAGRKRAALNLISREYFRDTATVEVAKQWQMEHPGIVENTGAADDRLTQAQLKFKNYLLKTGMLNGIMRNQRYEFNRIFRR